jgi:hypothetical protein
MAVLMLILGLTDMNQNYCDAPGGCLAPQPTQPRFMMSQGEVIHRRAKPADEAYMRYDPGTKLGPFGQAAGFSVGQKGEVWAGYGATYSIPLGLTGFYIEFHLMPGVYLSNGGFDLGGWLEFRSGIEVGYETASGWRYALGYDHRSNGGTFKKNPGMETMHLRVSAPYDGGTPGD